MNRDRADAVGAGTSARGPGAEDAPVPEEAEQLQNIRQFMVRAWSELLSCSGLTEFSDFFVRGGDSLLMTRLVRRIRDEFGVTVSLQDMSRRNLGDQALLVHELHSRMMARQSELPPGARNVGAFVRSAWSELLGRRTLTGASDFFALGGDSLLMTRLVRRVEKEYGVRMPVHDMLAAPTLGEQTLLVRSHVDAVPHVARRLRGRAA